MKRILLILSVVLCFSSCDDFLDTENLTQKTTGNFPATEKEASEMLVSIYANLLFEDPETSSEYYIAQLASDDCLGGNLSASNNCATNFLMYKNTLNGYSGIWSRCFRLINRANNAISSFPNCKSWSSEKEKNRMYGEAYFLRAIAYYELAQVFGRVPIHTEFESTARPQSEIDDVYKLVADDLQKAIELMPNQIYTFGNSMAGHATKYAAEGYMARVFLYYTGRYAKDALPNGITKSQVIDWIDDCVQNSGHDLVSDQRNLWSYTNAITNNNAEGYKYNYVVNNKLNWANNSAVETMFANKHNLKGNWTYTWWSNTVSQFYSPSGDKMVKKESYPFGQGWGAGPVSPAMVEEWKAWSKKQSYIDGYTEDPRLTGSIWSYKANDPNNVGTVLFDRSLTKDEPAYTVSQRYYEQTGYFQKKYINILAFDGANFVPFGIVMYPNINNPAITSQSLLNIADLIHLRFADVLLMQSELKQDPEGMNRVRARSHLAPLPYSLDNIKNERRWELAFESIRWWDMLRWAGPTLTEAGTILNNQKGFTVINAAVVVPMVEFDYASRLQKTQGYWPIPQNEIDKSNGAYTQNPGWDASALFTDWNNMK
ncbi:MAG: RagB/SusD family nutrient uptake outer membrane protein [Muribaculaceae bacterium]|nr:RagB/SusD family nutrient uptake outer membrane protein [Muribaculaceae bacterium]